MSSTAFDILQTADLYQKQFVTPVVDAMKVELRGHLDKIEDAMKGLVGQVNQNTADITALKSNQKKALVGYSVYTTAAAGLFAYCWSWIKGHFRIT